VSRSHYREQVALWRVNQGGIDSVKNTGRKFAQVTVAGKPGVRIRVVCQRLAIAEDQRTADQPVWLCTEADVENARSCRRLGEVVTRA
jgi:hypothetical protein